MSEQNWKHTNSDGTEELMDTEELQRRLMAINGYWSNDACQGYAYRVLQDFEEIDQELKNKILRHFGSAFEMLTVKEAKALWEEKYWETI